MTQDANTAALNKKERSDASNDAIVDAYQERAIEELTDDIMRGEKVAGWSRIEFVEVLLDLGEIATDDMSTLIFGNVSDAFAEDARDRLIKQIEQDVRAWLSDTVAGQGAVSDLCHELAADDKERHKEERGSSE